MHQVFQSKLNISMMMIKNTRIQYFFHGNGCIDEFCEALKTIKMQNNFYILGKNELKL